MIVKVDQATGNIVDERVMVWRSTWQRRSDIERAARRVLAAFDKERDRLTHAQWAALEALEEAVYGGDDE